MPIERHQKGPSAWMPIDYSHNAAARANRVVKAYRLADAVEELGRIPDAQQRRALLKAAGVRSASDETWSMAVEIYIERHPSAVGEQDATG